MALLVFCHCGVHGHNRNCLLMSVFDAHPWGLATRCYTISSHIILSIERLVCDNLIGEALNNNN